MRDGQASNRILNIKAHHSDITKPRAAFDPYRGLSALPDLRSYDLSMFR